MHPRTDIICLVHNQLDVTKKFVEHLFANTENFRLIFVDNGSDDETLEWITRNIDWVTVCSRDRDSKRINAGIIGGRNFGATFINNDYFLNIDNDQYVGKGWLDMLHAKMAEGYDIVGKEAWKLVQPGKGGMVVIGGVAQKRDYFPHKHCERKGENWTYIGCGGMLIKTSVYKDIGLFDEQFNPAYFEDPDFCFRAIQAGYKLNWCPECPIEHLNHQTTYNQKLFDKNAQFQQSWTKFKKKWNPYFPGE